jgi:pimeloyl-ACP methyl ester carboxylesterase
MMRKAAVIATAVGLVFVGAVAAPLAHAAPAPSTADRSAFVAAPVSWGACQMPALQAAGAECGFVGVPLDYDDPAGTKIQLAVSRVKHRASDSQYQGAMLVNPGGPGGSGLGLSRLGGKVPNNAGASYDWIGFDPRGVGSSRPALSCIRDYAGYRRPHYVPDTPEIEDVWRARARDYAQACGSKGGALLSHVKTVDSARDIDSIRQALGVEQINYYGFSYGTYLGQVYATLYPERVRRMVLDGNVNAHRVWYEANLDQDIAFERNIKIFFDWVAKYDGIYELGNSGPDVEKLYYAEYAKLRQKPAGGIIGSSEWNDIFLQAGYYIFGWEDIATAFSNWVHKGDFNGLKKLYDASNSPVADNGYAVYLAVQCTDVQWPTDFAIWRRDNQRVYQQAPFETWANAWFNAPCLYWPAKAGTPVKIDGHGVPPVLLISETLDAATPFEGSLTTRRLFPNSVLVEGVGGTTHAASLFGGACVDNRVAEYLASGHLPPRQPGNRSDLGCEPLAQPVPTGLKIAEPGGASSTASRAAQRPEPPQPQ